jgi:hypothetical protein
MADHMKRSFFSFLFAGITTTAFPQCDTLVLGVQDTVSMGPETTPFPTAYRNAKVQYLIQSTELLSLGCPIAGPIYALRLTVVDDDIALPSPGAQFTAEVRIRNVNYPGGLTAFDPVTGGPSNGMIAPYDTSGGIVNAALQAGDLYIPLDLPFSYVGGDVIVEVCFTMDALLGSSPRVALDTALGYNATHYGHDVFLNDGCAMTEAVPATAARGLNKTRPVIGFIFTPTPGAGMLESAVPHARIFPVPASDHVIVPATLLRADDRRIELVDVMGRRTLSQMIGNTSGTVTVQLTGIPSGPYTMQVISAAHERRPLGVVVVE